MGRFINEDPISFAGGDVNLYRYVENNPVDSIDPSGTIALIDDVTIFAIVIVALGIGIAANNINETINRKRDRDRKRERVDDIPIPLDPPCDEKKDAHRGRIQAQGDGTEKSVPWARNTPPTRTDGLTYLIILKSQLTKRELKDREGAFIKAEKYINNAAQAGGIVAFPTKVSRTFRKDGYTGSNRVDIEVITGIAFIPD